MKVQSKGWLFVSAIVGIAAVGSQAACGLEGLDSATGLGR